MLTKKEAWKLIAEAYYLPSSKRSNLQHKLTTSGICNASQVLAGEDIVGSSIAWNMESLCLDLVGKYMYFIESDYWECSTSRQSNILRADFCMLQYYVLGGE